MRFLVGVCLGAALGVAMLLMGGLAVDAGPAPACPGCAVVMQNWPGCHGQAVQGGWVCQ